MNNPYWNEVKDQVSAEPDSVWGTRMITGLDPWALRRTMAKTYSWTVTNPQTVSFVAHYSRGNLIDPMAGTGYWGYLLTQAGVNCVSSDKNPPFEFLDVNIWHPHASQHVPVTKMDAAEAVHDADAVRTLLLSWPPADGSASDALKEYRGERVIFIGEYNVHVSGDEELFQTFEKHWHEKAFHKPIQYYGIHDFVTVLDRNH